MSEATSQVTFASLGLDEKLVEACEVLGWKVPTEIQAQTIPAGLLGRDVVGLAETGSGKTAAFMLPIIHNLIRAPQAFYALVLTPTRELAFQISEQIESIGGSFGVKCTTIVGGIDIVQQAIALAKKPHIVVATPGRIVDHFENTKGFSMRNLKYLVMDEADRMLNLDFEEELAKILEVIPQERNTFLFSATMSAKIEKLQRASLREPVRLEVSKNNQTVEKLMQHYMFIPSKYKDVYLAWLLNEHSGTSSIIFTSACATTHRISYLLNSLGFPAIPLHGKMPQIKRLGALARFKAQSNTILIATDVASRGLDIPHVDLVVNYDIPLHSKDYIHRVGRTARAGRAGKSITLVTQYDIEIIQRIEEFIGKKMTDYPSHEQDVLLLLDRVSEAQRYANAQLKDADIDLKRSRDIDLQHEESSNNDTKPNYPVNRRQKREPKKKRSRK